MPMFTIFNFSTVVICYFSDLLVLHKQVCGVKGASVFLLHAPFKMVFQARSKQFYVGQAKFS